MIPDPIFLMTLVGILFLHEAGHWLAMRYYGYQDTAIFFIPFLGAMVAGSKRNLSESQSAVIILAGPLPGFILGWVLFQWGSNFVIEHDCFDNFVLCVLYLVNERIQLV